MITEEPLEKWRGTISSYLFMSEKKKLDCGKFPSFFLPRLAELEQTYRLAGLRLEAWELGAGKKIHTRRLVASRFSEFRLINYPLSENGELWYKIWRCGGWGDELAYLSVQSSWWGIAGASATHNSLQLEKCSRPQYSGINLFSVIFDPWRAGFRFVYFF